MGVWLGLTFHRVNFANHVSMRDISDLPSSDLDIIGKLISPLQSHLNHSFRFLRCLFPRKFLGPQQPLSLQLRSQARFFDDLA